MLFRSPAEQAGLKSGDVVVALNGEKIDKIKPINKVKSKEQLDEEKSQQAVLNSDSALIS